jgi:Thermostable hemolysin
MQARLESQLNTAPVPGLHHGTAPASQPEHLQLHLWLSGDPQRTAAESFIRARFQDTYDADVCVFHPYLLGVTRGDGNITAVIGLRPAGCGRFFLESYLDGSAEQLLANATGETIQRKQVVEVGNLASVDTESFRFLMIGLITLLDRLPETRWIVCTVGEKLIRLLQRTRFFPIVINQASAERLSPEDGKWGSYYRHARSVVAGNVAYGMLELKRQNIWRPEFAERIERILQGGIDKQI